MFYNWLMKDAEWYEFWMPQSGPVGGAIVGLAVSAIGFGAYFTFWG